VAFEEGMLGCGLFGEGGVGWCSKWRGWVGVIITWAAGVVSGVSAEVVAIFRDEGVSGEELEAIAEGPSGFV
jgi:hypothetical protein